MNAIPTLVIALTSMLGVSSAGAQAEVPAYHPPYIVEWSGASQDSSGSMPLGNGDISANVWVEPGGDVLFYIGKTDAWSGNGRLLKVGRVRLHFDMGMPFEDCWLRQVLDVREAAVHIEWTPKDAAPGDRPTPAALAIRIWVDANYPAIRVVTHGPRPCTVTARVESWRTEPRALGKEELHSAYGLISSPDPVIVEPDTFVDGLKRRVVWYHRNEESIYPLTLSHQGVGDWLDAAPDPLLHRTFGGLIAGTGNTVLESSGPDSVRTVASKKEHTLAVYALTDQTPTAGEWVEQATALAERDTVTWDRAWFKHFDWWRAFWARSWIHATTPGGDENPEGAPEIVTRGYTLQRYITACAGRGAYPIKFNGSIFTVDAEEKGNRLDADYRRWGGPYWFQNTRLAYWPMLATGDYDLMAPLFGMYRDALPFARARTQTYFGHGGAFFPETMYFWGAYAIDNYGWDREGKHPGITDNRYIRYYYSGALELTAMMLDHAAHTGDEAFVRDTLIPFADEVVTFYGQHYKRNTDGVLHIEPSQSLETWHEAIDPLPPIAGLRWVLDQLLAYPEDFASSAQRASWKELFDCLPAIPLKDADGGPVLAPAGEVIGGASNSENPELYAVFPYRFYGVGKPDLDMARRTFAARRVKDNKGWRQDEIQAAYLGLAGEASSRLAERFSHKHEGSRFPAFWGPNFDWIPDQDHGTSGMIALQTMLLQTDGRAIRLFPAWPKGWDVHFKLHAPMNTTVEAVYRDGAVEKVVVMPESRRKDVIVCDPQ